MSKKSAIIILFLFIFVAVNLVASQLIDGRYSLIALSPTNQNIASFLTKIKDSVFFKDQLSYYSQFNPKAVDIYKKDEEKMTIEMLEIETKLQNNPNSRELLIKVAVLAYQNNQFTKARSYYIKAKNIDPNIKIGELEKLL